MQKLSKNKSGPGANDFADPPSVSKQNTTSSLNMVITPSTSKVSLLPKKCSTLAIPANYLCSLTPTPNYDYLHSLTPTPTMPKYLAVPFSFHVKIDASPQYHFNFGV